MSVRLLLTHISKQINKIRLPSFHLYCFELHLVDTLDEFDQVQFFVPGTRLIWFRWSFDR